MTNFFKNLLNLINFKKNEKNYQRIFFNENKNTFKYLEPYLNLSKKNACIISLENIEKKNLSNTTCYNFDNNFIVSIFFLILKVKYLYTSTPDLNQTLFKRSVFNITKYIYIQHSPVSLSMAYREKAFIHFDAIQSVNKNQYSDILDINRLHSKKIKPFKYKYLFLDSFKKNKIVSNAKIDFLIAPTWNTNFYKLNLHTKIFKILKDAKKTFVFRPHYMSIIKNELDVSELNLNSYEIDTNSLLSFENYANLISDWSGIYLEFAILKQIKPILINSMMKVRNEEYKKFSMEPIELELRNLISIQFEPNNLDKFTNYTLNDKPNNIEQEDLKNILISKFY